MGCIKGIPHGAQIGRKRPVNTELMYGDGCEHYHTCFECPFADCGKRKPELNATVIQEINDIESFLSIKTGGCDYESSCKSYIFRLSCSLKGE